MEKFSTKEKLYLIKEKVQHEDNLIVNRINWLIVTQAGLLACFFSSSVDPNSFSHYAIIIIAILLCVVFGNSIHFCDLSLKKLRKRYKKYQKKMLLNPHDNILFVGYSSDNDPQNSLLSMISRLILPSYLLAFLLAIFWIIMLICSLAR